jgi:hypothetical protein
MVLTKHQDFSRGDSKMSVQSRITSKMVLSVVAAAFATITAGAFADEAVKSGGASDKPGRAIDDSVKSRGASSQPGRTVDEDKSAVTTGKADRPGRTLNEEKSSKKKHKKAVDQ